MKCARWRTSSRQCVPMLMSRVRTELESALTFVLAPEVDACIADAFVSVMNCFEWCAWRCRVCNKRGWACVDHALQTSEHDLSVLRSLEWERVVRTARINSGGRSIIEECVCVLVMD